MDNREANAQKHAAERFVPTQRLPYRSPTLVEYGNVSKLTEGAVGSMADSASMTTGRSCL